MGSTEEYQAYLQANLTWLESFGDKLSSTDERLDFIVKHLLASQLSPETIAMLQELTPLLQALKEAGFEMPLETQQINFRETIQPTMGARFEEQVPLDGFVTSITMHFPQNCNSLVDVAIGHGHKQICPISGFIALNDACPVFPVHEKCARNETVWCIMNNHDGGFAHTVSCIITIEGV